jgi:anti-sigma B factor antagonist
MRVPSDDLKIETSESGACTVYRLTGSLDVATSPVLKTTLVSAAGQAKRDVIVDLTQLEFLDSTGLGALMGAHRRAIEKGGRVVLIVHEGPISRLLNITGLSRVFSVYTSVDEAVAGIGSVK